MDRLSEEGKKRGVGTPVAEDSARWPTQAAGGVRKVLSPVTWFFPLLQVAIIQGYRYFGRYCSVIEMKGKSKATNTGMLLLEVKCSYTYHPGFREHRVYQQKQLLFLWLLFPICHHLILIPSLSLFLLLSHALVSTCRVIRL
jgi:hypothetical protein